MISLINYPPTTEQLRILEFMGLLNRNYLPGLRFFSLIILVITILLWFRFLKNSGIKPMFGTVLAVISPVLIALVIGYPLILVKVFVFSLIIQIKTDIRLKTAVLAAVITAFNLAVAGNRPEIINQLNPAQIQAEVNQRFIDEDSLNMRITAPLWWRRIGNNKYFFTYRKAMAQVLPYFDLENWYFQEENPFYEKGLIVFFWPEIILLITGIYVLSRGRKRQTAGILAMLFTAAIVNFVFSDGPTYLRQVFSIFPLGIVMALGAAELWKNKFIFIPVMILIAYALQANLNDLTTRPDYSFDNRPLTYEFWFKNLTAEEINKYQTVRITTRIGDPTKYCYFYLQDLCRKQNFVFKDFSFPADENLGPGLYMGFTGEYIGVNNDNHFPENWTDSLGGGFQTIKTMTVRDSIAYRYGNGIAVIYKK